VLNPLSGYLMLAQALWESNDFATAWNFGPADDEARPVRWLVERVHPLWPSELRWEHDAGRHPHEAGYLKLDSSRARGRLGWRPTWGLPEALDRIVAWYRAFADGAEMRAATIEQIEAFAAAQALGV
jgi:CDP-glucose 4,6-dehydratase